MDIRNWKNFEEKFNLQPIFKGYVGGFHPSTFNRIENKSLANLILLGWAKVLVFIFKKLSTFYGNSIPDISAAIYSDSIEKETNNYLSSN